MQCECGVRRAACGRRISLDAASHYCSQFIAFCRDYRDIFVMATSADSLEALAWANYVRRMTSKYGDHSIRA